MRAHTRPGHCHNRPRSLHSSFPPADRAERGYATYQELLDDLHGPGVFEALVPRLPCFRAGFPPRDGAKRRVADDTTHAVGLEEALLAMGFPADWFDGLGLDDRDAWRILGNSVHVPLLELFYESLLDVYAARHGDDVDAERRRAIAVARSRAKAAFDF